MSPTSIDDLARFLLIKIEQINIKFVQKFKMTSKIIHDFVEYHKGYGILPDNTIAPSFEMALNEIKTGKKTSHWAWYIMPTNKSSRTFGNMFVLQNDEQIKAYISNPLLYNNYITFLTTVIEQLQKIKPIDLLNSHVDVNKLYDSVSLFNQYASDDNILFERTLTIQTLLSVKNTLI